MEAIESVQSVQGASASCNHSLSLYLLVQGDHITQVQVATDTQLDGDRGRSHSGRGRL